MLFFFQNVKDLQVYSIRDSENLAAHPQKEFSGVPSPPWALTFTGTMTYIAYKPWWRYSHPILGCCVPHEVLNPDHI